MGNPVVGKTITITAGAWSGDYRKLKTTYRWLRDGRTIAGATGEQYTPSGADFGKTLSVRVISKLDGRTLTSQRVGATTKVAAGTLHAHRPKLTGKAARGSVLTAKRGSWTKGTRITYRWLRNGKPIPRAYGPTYKVVKADKYARISVKVTGRQAGYTTASRESFAFIAR